MSATVTFSVDTAQGPRDVSVVHRRAGSGDPVLLLHGIGHHHQAWDPVFSILAAERDVIAVDLPGFGASPALPDGFAYDLAGFVPVLGALCAALDIERPHVVGNSLGGLLALEMGREKLVRTVTALSPAGFWTQAERRYAFGTLLAMHRGASLLPRPAIERMSRSAAGRTALTSTIYARPWRRSPEAVVAETLALRESTGFHETLAAGRTVQLRDAFAMDTDAVPVTVAWGTRDRLLLRRQGVRAKHTLPGARLVRLPGCGHVPMNDDPALVARVILDATA
ncbi:alpha/beta fold hydrolase [Streptomyces indicus]|uniref:Pimeloyl-ACP methyl ester carboxylesterase n=1 Tax=Streptomyces indicus TaxID=417292 RepID=A0A1G9A0B6_9ACTN|nr:alpha/beta fold hydrolase [Streptomyces indicus]SDK20798.1 Pimeloyl-ACP methyl ester carboxylesterase [Streptomyces indicus]